MPKCYREGIEKNRKGIYMYMYTVPAQDHSKLHVVLYEDSIRDVARESLIITDQIQMSEVVCDGHLTLSCVLTRDVGLNVGEQVIH